ncbi:uncharacterized protein BDW70DRAFT_171137 [Aspergillus foveolatus]|uniref:uncharacterized protein n=1 Tax=Aspergillus foveolatus TaxID=210207 RepID=UPI003CCCFFEF
MSGLEVVWKTLITFRHKEVYVIRLIQSLRDQHYHLVSDIRLTLHGAGVNYDTLSTDRLPALFRDHNIAEAVKEYLGSDSHVYFQAVDRCHAVSDRPRLVRTYGGQCQLPETIRFTLKRDELDKQIQGLDSATMMLRRISDNMAALRAKFPCKNQRLYSAVAAAYPSHCHSCHEARLALRSRSYFLERAEEEKHWKDFTFTVMFSPVISASGPTNLYRTDIKVAKGDDGPDEHRSATPSAKEAEPRLTAMDDLCEVIRLARDGEVAFDLQVSEGTRLMYYYPQASIHSNSMHLAADPDGFVTLEQLLKEPDASWLPYHRIALSLTIASSLLQLSAVHSAMLDLSSIPESFVEERICRPTATGAGCSESGVKECMLELGILLLEIAHWNTIDEYGKGAQNKGLSASATRYDLAKAWMDEIRYLILKVHWDLIMRCIENTFATSNPDPRWDDLVFRKSVAELVVKPLQENCIQHLR